MVAPFFVVEILGNCSDAFAGKPRSYRNSVVHMGD